jgi:hypothetical protein
MAISVAPADTRCCALKVDERHPNRPDPATGCAARLCRQREATGQKRIAGVRNLTNRAMIPGLCCL